MVPSMPTHAVDYYLDEFGTFRIQSPPFAGSW